MLFKTCLSKFWSLTLLLVPKHGSDFVMIIFKVNFVRCDVFGTRKISQFLIHVSGLDI